MSRDPEFQARLDEIANEFRARIEAAMAEYIGRAHPEVQCLRPKIEIEVTWDLVPCEGRVLMALSIADQVKAFRDLSQKQIQRAAARSLNRAITSTRAEAAKRVREVINIKSGDVKDVIVLGKANVNESLGKMSASVVIKAKLIPLYAFSPSVKRVKTAHGYRMGVSVKVKGQRKLVIGGFVATVGAGHVGIFKRKGEGRLPIKELFGPTVASLFKNEAFTLQLLTYAKLRVAENFERELKYQLSKVQ